MKSEIYIFGSSTNAQACLAVCRKHGIAVAGFLDEDIGAGFYGAIPVPAWSASILR